MEIIKTNLDDVLIIQPRVFEDSRGWFCETYSKQKFLDRNLNFSFVQDNHSLSVAKGTIRGLHFQIGPKAQTKLVRCTRGRILDVAVDLRRGAGTYMKWVGVELSAENKKQLLIPKGFAHGFLTLTDDVEVQYKVDEYYSPECDRSIRYDDPQIGIDWGITDPVLSDKDLNAPLLKDSDSNFSLKYMVTGANGQLGFELVKKLKSLNVDVIATDKEEFDITDYNATREFIESNMPDVIFHCAAYTAVDKAEEEQELCYAINVEGTANITKAAKGINAVLVYISTDYVFNGKGNTPYREDGKINPVNFYGLTKAKGENIVKEHLDKYYIVRTSWLYGINGNNFVKTMLKLSKTGKEINVVSDQIGAPTYAKDLAEFLVTLVGTNKYGIYHGVNEGFCSWYEFASEIFKQSGVEVKVNPVLTSKYPTKATRPLNSRLGKENTDLSGFSRLPDWRKGLMKFLEEWCVD